jgi:hypothetical protein
MERYPILDLILRYGRPGAYVAALIAAALVVGFGWPGLGWISLALGLLAAGFVFLLVKSYVEIVTIITEMLVPR